MTGYDFHPEAEADLNEIWGYIAADSVDAAFAEIHGALENVVPFPHQGHKRSDLTTRPYGSSGCAIT
jgi:plasmid stabilization system protein ParE